MSAEKKAATAQWEAHLQTHFPNVRAASARLQSSFGLHNPTPFPLPAIPPPHGPSSATSSSTTDNPPRLVATLEALADMCGSSSLALISLSLRDITPDMRTGAFSNVPLLHREAEDMLRLRVFEVELPGEGGAPEHDDDEGERWTYFVLEEEFEEGAPRDDDYDYDDNDWEHDGTKQDEKRGPGETAKRHTTERKKKRWMAFGCPVSAVEHVEDKKERMRGKDRRKYFLRGYASNDLYDSQPGVANGWLMLQARGTICVSSSTLLAGACQSLMATVGMRTNGGRLSGPWQRAVVACAISTSKRLLDCEQTSDGLCVCNSSSRIASFLILASMIFMAYRPT